jgi:hypothetical protein
MLVGSSARAATIFVLDPAPTVIAPGQARSTTLAIEFTGADATAAASGIVNTGFRVNSDVADTFDVVSFNAGFDAPFGEATTASSYVVNLTTLNVLNPGSPPNPPVATTLLADGVTRRLDLATIELNAPLSFGTVTTLTVSPTITQTEADDGTVFSDVAPLTYSFTAIPSPTAGFGGVALLGLLAVRRR